MMSMFSSVLDFNNLAGQPNQKYHNSYHKLDFLRDRFFDDVENEPDLEKFTSFYKWIDNSISVAIRQLVPAGSRFSERINNMVESHVLERSKYRHQVPLTTTYESTEGSIKGISEMKYDWKHGHAPLHPEEEQNNVLWQKDRKERDGLRETLRSSRNNESIQSSGLLRREIDGSARISDTYAVRKFAKNYDVSMISQPSFHGGVNFSRQKNLQLFQASIAPAGRLESTPQNISVVGLGEGDGLIRGVRNDDNPPRKKQYDADVSVGNQYGNEYGHNVLASSIFPMNIMSGNVNTGFNKAVKSYFAYDVVFANLHHDLYGNYNEAGMQGPFTEAYVGGLQYRHIPLNRFNEDKRVRVPSLVSGTFPSGSIEYDANNIEIGSWVQVKDGDGTVVTAYYSDVYDLYDSQWTNLNELVSILGNKLDLTLNPVAPSTLHMTQSFTGSFYNYSILSSPNGHITSSGFSGGTSLGFTTTSENLDGPENRAEGWALVFKDHPIQGDNDGAFGFVGADYGSPYPHPNKAKATRFREETAKRPVNAKNIKTQDDSKVGNYAHEYDLFTVSSEFQKTWAIEALNDLSVEIMPPLIAESLPETTNYQTLLNYDLSDIEKPRTDLTGSKRNINTRFSAPGGPEIQTISYLDAYTQTYSTHNALPWRNLSVLGSGSGETGTIRVEDELGLRRGLKTLRALHQGKFGIDSQHGQISEITYPSSGSFNKQHRNTSTIYVWNAGTDITASLSEPELITGSAYDNMHINSPIPRSEFQYSWIHAATYGDDKPTQHLLGYAPKDGEISSSAGWVSAIVFPSASSIVGS
jgi:hypothetical protein